MSDKEDATQIYPTEWLFGINMQNLCYQNYIVYEFVAN